VDQENIKGWRLYEAGHEPVTGNNSSGAAIVTACEFHIAGPGDLHR